MNTILFILTLFLLQAICWWIGKRSSRKCSTQTDYFLGGKGVGFFPLMMTFLGGQVGGGLVLGSAQEAVRIGWWVLLYPLGQVLGMIWLSGGMGKRLASFGVPTVAQIFEKHYGSKRLKEIASLLSIVSLFMLLVAQVLATRGFLVTAGVDNIFWFFLFWGVVLTYTGMGGFKAVIKTDLVQASFFLVMFGLAFVWAFFSSSTTINPIASVSESISLSQLSGWLLMPCLFAVLEQDMGQRCFAAKSPTILRRAAFCAGCLTFITCLVPIYFGVLAKETGISMQGGAGVLLQALQATTSPWMTALVGAAIMAAILATADSLLNAITSNISQDFSWFSKRSLNATRLLTIFLGASALFVSFYLDSIVRVVIQAYELSVCTLVVPLLAALFKKTPGNARSAMLSIASGALVFFFLRFVSTDLPREGTALACSFMGYAWGEIRARRARVALEQ